MGFLRDAYNKGLNLVGTGLLSSIPLYTMESLFGMAGTRILLIFAFICFSIWLFHVSITAYVERSIAALRQKHDQKKQGRSMPQENVEIEAKIIKMPTAQQRASARPQYSNAPEAPSGRRPNSTTPYFEPSLVKNPSPIEVDEIEMCIRDRVQVFCAHVLVAELAHDLLAPENHLIQSAGKIRLGIAAANLGQSLDIFVHLCAHLLHINSHALQYAADGFLLIGNKRCMQ